MFKFRTLKKLAVATGVALITFGCSKDDDIQPILDDTNGSVIVINGAEQIDGESWEERGEDITDVTVDDLPPLGDDEPIWHRDSLPTREELRAKFVRILDSLRSIRLSAAPSNTNKLTELMSAQFVTFNDVIKTDNWKTADGRNPKRSTNLQTNYYVWAAYSFDEDRDYYIIEQEIIIPNSNLWDSKVRETIYNLGFNVYRTKDYWMSKIWTNNEIQNANTGVYPFSDLAISQYSPETVNNATSYTSGISVEIGGEVGYMSGAAYAKVGAGVTFQNSKSWTVSDVKVLAKVMDKSYTKNAKWEWETTKKPSYQSSKVSINDPADLAINTARFGTTWLWIVDKPKKDDKYKLNLTVGGEHGSSHFQIIIFPETWMTHQYYSWSFNHNFVLTPPNRIK